MQAKSSQYRQGKVQKKEKEMSKIMTFDYKNWREISSILQILQILINISQ